MGLYEGTSGVEKKKNKVMPTAWVFNECKALPIFIVRCGVPTIIQAGDRLFMAVLCERCGSALVGPEFGCIRLQKEVGSSGKCILRTFYELSCNSLVSTFSALSISVGITVVTQ